LDRGGKFCLSDDSHSVDQVALNYHQLLPFLQKTGINTLYFLTYKGEDLNTWVEELPNCRVESMDIEELRDHNFKLS
jgi:histidinol-phosphatase (PHP family)